MFHTSYCTGQEAQEGAEERDLLHGEAVRSAIQGQEEGRQALLQAAQTKVSCNFEMARALHCPCT